MFAVASLVAPEGKELACNVGDAGSIPGSGRRSGERNGYPLQDPCPENSMDRGAWWVTVHGVSKSLTWLSTLAHATIDKLSYLWFEVSVDMGSRRAWTSRIERDIVWKMKIDNTGFLLCFLLLLAISPMQVKFYSHRLELDNRTKVVVWGINEWRKEGCPAEAWWGEWIQLTREELLPRWLTNVVGTLVLAAVRGLHFLSTALLEGWQLAFPKVSNPGDPGRRILPTTLSQRSWTFAVDHQATPIHCGRLFSLQFSSVQSCPTVCKPLDCSTPGLPVHSNSWSLLKLMSIESFLINK